jgi:AraC-like DNA-binding protein
MMSPNGQLATSDGSATAAILVGTFPMAAGARFTWHTHPSHQLAWAASGVLTVVAHAGTWVLPPTRALWIPAGVAHETIASGATTMKTLYLRPARCPIAWPTPQPVVATRLLGALIEHLADAELGPASRARAEAVVLDLLEPVDVVTIEVELPRDERAREVALGLLEHPSDQRTLHQWGRSVGASARTLTRAFLADTGIPFSRWRTAARLRTALPRLAAGEPVATVATAVGYETASAFVAAFRRETGLTPGGYFRAPAGARAITR